MLWFKPLNLFISISMTIARETKILTLQEYKLAVIANELNLGVLFLSGVPCPLRAWSVSHFCSPGLSVTNFSSLQRSSRVCVVVVKGKWIVSFSSVRLHYSVGQRLISSIGVIAKICMISLVIEFFIFIIAWFLYFWCEQVVKMEAFFFLKNARHCLPLQSI